MYEKTRNDKINVHYQYSELVDKTSKLSHTIIYLYVFTFYQHTI